MTIREEFKASLARVQLAIDTNQFAQAQAQLKFALELLKIIRSTKTDPLAGIQGEVASALTNLGATPERARAIAMELKPGDLNSMITEGFRRYRQTGK